MSFISVRLVFPALVGLTEPGGSIVVLIKPQFEAGRQEAARGRGVITDPEIRDRVVDEVNATAASLGAVMLGIMDSPVPGSAGNVELLAHYVVDRPSAGHEGSVS